MSKKQNGVLVTAPLFGTGRETVGEFPGYSCGYCQGNGYFQGDITVWKNRRSHWETRE